MATWKGIVGKRFTAPEFAAYVAELKFTSWRPSVIVLHNTAVPKLSEWHATPFERRMENLAHFYRNIRGWSAGPHLFVDDVGIGVLTPLTVSGVHSPSWNGISIGIEMVGDFSVEDDDAGAGLKVKRNSIAAIAILCAKLGIDPASLRLHKEDPRTDHDCPGKDVAQDKPAIIQAVLEYMGEGGEHPDVVPMATPEKMAAPSPSKRGKVVVPAGDHLNLREGSSAGSAIVAQLQPGASVEVFNEAMNGQTKWLRVEAEGEQGCEQGWVAARFVKVEEEPKPLPTPSPIPAPSPTPAPGPATGRKIIIIFQRGLGGGPTTMGMSLGLDALAKKADARDPARVEFYVYEHTEDDLALQDAVDAARDGYLIVLGGHSLGALSAAQLSVRLNAMGIKVALLFLFDSTWNAPAPDIEGNVARAIAYYGTSFFSPLGHDKIEPAPSFEAARGFITNIPVNVLHQNVDDNLGAHTMFLREIDQLLAARG